MNKFLLIVFLVGSALLVSFEFATTQEVLTIVPEGWPDPSYDFSKNPLTEEGFQLGRKLFYDPELSRDGTISCANCHLQFTGFTHVDHAVSHGIDGRKGTRNSPVLINLAWGESFHWDGGVNHLDVQAMNPIQHPAEMDNSLENVLNYVNSSQQYRAMFYDAYGDSMATTKNLLQSFSQFTLRLVSANSKYDRYLKGEANFSEQEINGYSLFKRFCASCHTEPLFTTNQFSNNGLAIDTTYNDLGRYGITHDGKDSLQFKIPTLRNIEHTYPYMHDGRFNKLTDVLEHYAHGIDRSSDHLGTALKGKIALSDNDQKDLVAFLRTLTDREFLYNKRFGFPR